MSDGHSIASGLKIIIFNPELFKQLINFIIRLGSYYFSFSHILNSIE